MTDRRADLLAAITTMENRLLAAVRGEADRLRAMLAPDDVPDDPVAALVAEYRARCRDEGWLVDGAGRVREPYAAQLLGKAPGTLKNRRHQDEPIESDKDDGGRVWYRLADLARYHLEHGDLAD